MSTSEDSNRFPDRGDEARQVHDPHGETAYGARDFSWTAALYLDLLADAASDAE
jgi:hypothetical protein